MWSCRLQEKFSSAKKFKYAIEYSAIRPSDIKKDESMPHFYWHKYDTVKFTNRGDMKNSKTGNVYVYTPYPASHNANGTVIQEFKGAEAAFYHPWHPIRMWDCLVGNPSKPPKVYKKAAAT